MAMLWWYPEEMGEVTSATDLDGVPDLALIALTVAFLTCGFKIAGSLENMKIELVLFLVVLSSHSRRFVKP